MRVPSDDGDSFRYGSFDRYVRDMAVIEVSQPDGGRVTRAYPASMVRLVTHTDAARVEAHLMDFQQRAMRILKRRRMRLVPTRKP